MDDGRFLGALILGGAITVAASSVIAADPPWDWGDVPTWVASIGTVGTLAVSTRVLALESGERRRQQAFQRMAQARGIKLGVVTPVTTVRPAGASFTQVTREVVVTNQSGDAVHDVDIHVSVVPASAVVAGQSSTMDRPRQKLLADGGSITWRFAFDINTDAVSVMEPFEMLASVAFSDIDGARWRRDHDHRLGPAEHTHARWVLRR